MRKKIKKWGNAAGILFSREDLELYGLKIGDVVDVSDMSKVDLKVTKKKKETKKKDEKFDDVVRRLPQ